MSQSFHPHLRDGWAQATTALEAAAKPALADVNPADTVVQRMRAKLMGGGGTGTVLRGIDGTPGQAGNEGGAGNDGSNGSGGGGGGGGGGSSGGSNATESRLAGLETMVNGASISAECNGDGTITVTLTWG